MVLLEVDLLDLDGGRLPLFDRSQSHADRGPQVGAQYCVDQVDEVSPVNICFKTVNHHIPDTRKLKGLEHLNIHPMLSQSSVTHALHIDQVQKGEHVKKGQKRHQKANGLELDIEDLENMHSSILILVQGLGHPIHHRPYQVQIQGRADTQQGHPGEDGAREQVLEVEVHIDVVLGLEDEEHEEDQVQGQGEGPPEVQFEELLEDHIVRHLELELVRELGGVQAEQVDELGGHGVLQSVPGPRLDVETASLSLLPVEEEVMVVLVVLCLRIKVDE